MIKKTVVKHRTGILCFVTILLLCLSAVSGWAGYEEGERAYLSGDYAMAFRELQPLAQQGHAGAQFYLGLMYSYGRGVPQDYRQAVQWSRRAAEQDGHPPSRGTTACTRHCFRGSLTVHLKSSPGEMQVECR